MLESVDANRVARRDLEGGPKDAQSETLTASYMYGPSTASTMIDLGKKSAGRSSPSGLHGEEVADPRHLRRHVPVVGRDLLIAAAAGVKDVPERRDETAPLQAV